MRRNGAPGGEFTPSFPAFNQDTMLSSLFWDFGRSKFGSGADTGFDPYTFAYAGNPSFGDYQTTLVSVLVQSQTTPAYPWIGYTAPIIDAVNPVGLEIMVIQIPPFNVRNSNYF